MREALGGFTYREEWPPCCTLLLYSWQISSDLNRRSTGRSGLDSTKRWSAPNRSREAGGDGTFLEAPRTVAELVEIRKRASVLQIANMVEGGKTRVEEVPHELCRKP